MSAATTAVRGGPSSALPIGLLIERLLEKVAKLARHIRCTASEASMSDPIQRTSSIPWPPTIRGPAFSPPPEFVRREQRRRRELRHEKRESSRFRSAAAALPFLVAWLCASRAQADAAQPQGVELGARSGFGLPLGSASGAPGDNFSHIVTNIVPIWLDAGARVTPHVFVGAYFMYGIGSLPDSLASSCSTPGVSCTIHDIRLGADVQYHVAQGAWDPWVGAGIGFEWFGFDATAGGQSASVDASGWEFLNLQVGIDYRAADTFGIGPFVALTLAKFDHASATVPGSSSQSAAISNQALHEWFMIGLRTAFDLVAKPPKAAPPPDE
jgi:hypothetical protein